MSEYTNSNKKEILEYLATQRIHAIRFNTGCRSGVNYGHKGWADIIGFFVDNGKFVAIEQKQKGEQISREQLAFLYDVKAAGGFSAVVETVEDLIPKLKDYLQGVKV